MGLFANKKATESLAFRLGELTIEVRELKTAHNHLELEWEELYDKVRHQMSRMARRQRLETQDLVSEPVPEIENNGMPVVDPISRSIMMRRGIGRFGG